MPLRHRRVTRLVGLLVLVTGGLIGCGSDEADGDLVEPAVSSARAPLPAPRRTEVTGAFWDGKIVVVAGLLADDSPSAQVDVYDPATDRWSPGPPLPVPLHHTAAGVLGGRLYVVGGYTGTSGRWVPVADVRSLGPGETAWRAEPALAGPRGALAVATLDDALVAVGGVGSGREIRAEILRPGAPAWEPAPDLPHPTEHLAATGAGGRAYSIGGRYRSLEGNLATVHSLAPGERRWREEPDLNHTRGGIGAASPGGRPCVAGGEEPQGTIASVECLVDGRWRDVATLAVPRHGVAVVAVGDTLHVIGGGPQPALFVSDAHEAFHLSP
ncbi:MAG TPA: kelch repeat-containing protein [Acidimicrobiia bacterium]|nr:kelch repeat-containing protein [Acidimicrobiia bacterium]